MTEKWACFTLVSWKLLRFLIIENTDNDVSVIKKGFNYRILIKTKVVHNIRIDLNVETIHRLVLHVVTFEIKQSQLTALFIQIELIGCGLFLEIVVRNQQFLI